MAAIDLEVPSMGESVAEATLLKWHKTEGEMVEVDEPVCEMETDKANVDVPSTHAGVLKYVAKAGDTLEVGEVFAQVDPDGKASAKSAAPEKAGDTQTKAAESDDPMADLAPAVRRIVAENNLTPADIKGSGRGGRLTKEDVLGAVDALASNKTKAKEPESTPVQKVAEKQVKATPGVVAANGTRRVPMSKMRKAIAKNLIAAQHSAAILTTFNEVDLTEVMALRKKYKEPFATKHGIGLGFMSFFSKAVAIALSEFERVNAKIDGDDIVYQDFVNLGIAVSTERGLTVPVIKNVGAMSFAQIENEIKRVALAARDGKLALAEMSGGTFTITNGGVFGSLLSTPIISPPQSGILGMHTIQDRPMAVNGEVKIRPMMYVALSYDHRLVDGKESVSFLVRIKQLLEDPARLLLDV